MSDYFIDDLRKRFKSIQEIMDDYQMICKSVDCENCPFDINVAWHEDSGSEIKLCDAIDNMLGVETLR